MRRMCPLEKILRVIKMQPVCVSCGREMVCIQNGTYVWHPYEHAETLKAQQTIGDVTIINSDVLIEGSWSEGDIDFVASGDTYECPKCKHKIVTGFGQPMLDYDFKQEQLQAMVERGLTLKVSKNDGKPYAVKILRR